MSPEVLRVDIYKSDFGLPYCQSLGARKSKFKQVLSGVWVKLKWGKQAPTNTFSKICQSSKHPQKYLSELLSCKGITLLRILTQKQRQ